MFRRRSNAGKENSTKALDEAQASLLRVKERHDEVVRVSTALRELRERNHFADKLIVIMGGRNAAG